MRLALTVMAVLLVSGLSARTIHRSFKNGYPVLPGVSYVPEQPDSFCITSKKPAASKKNVIVITNRVVVAGACAGKTVKPASAKKPAPKREMPKPVTKKSTPVGVGVK